MTMVSAQRLEQIDRPRPPARLDAREREPEQQRAHDQRQHRTLRRGSDDIARDDRGQPLAQTPVAAPSAAGGVPMAARSDAINSGSRGSNES